MNDEKTNKIMSSEELDDVLPKYEPIKLSGKNLAQNYVSAFNTGMNIYQCINYLQGNIDWTINAVNDVVKSWNDSVYETLSKSIEITEETTTEQFNKEWTAKQPELIEQVNTLTTNQFNNEKSVFNDEFDKLNARMDTFSNPNLLINPDFRINQRGQNTYSSTGDIYTVDRWSVTNSTTIVNSDGTITISSLSGVGYCNYRAENTLYGKHAYSFYVQAITGVVTAFYRNNNDLDITLGTLKQGLNTFTPPNDDGFKRLIIVISSGASVTLKWVKLEQGEVATPFVAPNPAEELTKCYRFKYIGKAVLRAQCTGGQTFGFTKDLPTKLRTKPTTTFKSKDSYNVNTVDVTISEENNVVYIAGTAENTNQTVINVVLDLDAEIY